MLDLDRQALSMLDAQGARYTANATCHGEDLRVMIIRNLWGDHVFWLSFKTKRSESQKVVIFVAAKRESPGKSFANYPPPLEHSVHNNNIFFFNVESFRFIVSLECGVCLFSRQFLPEILQESVLLWSTSLDPQSIQGSSFDLNLSDS